jgi:hypothetical protein
MKTYSVTVFLKDYEWNPNTGQVEFRDSSMKSFEQSLPANSEGDPSVF